MATQLNDKQRALARFGVALALLMKRNNDSVSVATSTALNEVAELSPYYENVRFDEYEASELIHLLAKESVVCGPMLGDGETEADSELNEALSLLDGVKADLKQMVFNAGVPRTDAPGADLPDAPRKEG